MRANQPKSKPPYFSVVIPVFNRAAALGPTMESCLKQTFTDFEALVVDDGSGDNLKDVVKACKDPRVRYIWRTNGGGSAARNTGVQAAGGKYIAFLDSDDIFLEDKLLKCHRFLENNDCDCLYSQVYLDRGVGKYWIKPPRALAPKEHMADYLLRDQGWVPTPTLVVENNLAKKTLFREGMPFGQDMDFAIRLYNHGAKFHMLKEPLVICMDLYDPARVSFSRNYDELNKWTEDMREKIPSKAYLGNKGWRLAKTLAGESYLKALLLYANALLHGAYRPKMAFIIFCQIIFPRTVYRKIADSAAAKMGKTRNQPPPREPFPRNFEKITARNPLTGAGVYKMKQNFVQIGGVKISVVSKERFAGKMVQDWENQKNSGYTLPPCVSFDANGHAISMYARDEEFRKHLKQADAVTADGMCIVKASRRYTRTPLPERVATTDFFHFAARRAQKAGMSFYLLGGKREVLDRVENNLKKIYPNLKIAGGHHGYYSDEAVIVEDIKKCKPDVVWVGLGVPKQEKFCIDHKSNFKGVTWVKACGGLFDFIGGASKYKRAPRWMQDRGLEWCYRLAKEPRRLFWRYIVTNPHALYLIMRHSKDLGPAGNRVKDQ